MRETYELLEQQEDDNDISTIDPEEPKNSSKVKIAAPVIDPGDSEPPSNRLLALCFCGIFFSFLINGIYQEKITQGEYDKEGEDKFTFILCLVFLQCTFNAAVAKGLLINKKKTNDSEGIETPEDKTPTKLYISAGWCQMIGMIMSNKALAYISYPTKVIGKACKPIAVLFLGIALAGKRYGLKKFMCIGLIVVGIVMFMYNPEKAVLMSKYNAVDLNILGLTIGLGEFLVFGSLLCDGLTGVFQEKMRAKEFKTTQHDMMYGMNIWSIIVLIPMIVLSNEHMRFFEFQKKYPSVWLMIFIYNACSSIGQSFIFLTVVNFGPLMCSIITTSRKFFTILFSVILFRNPLSHMQWVATLFVFTGLGLDILNKERKADRVPENK